MTTHIKADDFTAWLAKAKPGEKLVYYLGHSFITDCEKKHALDKLRDAIQAAAFEITRLENCVTHWGDKGTLHLVQHRVGPRPEGNAIGLFEYAAIKRARGRS
jgi:hypothetical protein